MTTLPHEGRPFSSTGEAIAEAIEYHTEPDGILWFLPTTQERSYAARKKLRETGQDSPRKGRHRRFVKAYRSV